MPKKILTLLCEYILEHDRKFAMEIELEIENRRATNTMNIFYKIETKHK